MQINAHFDAGAIEIVQASQPEDIQLRIRADVAADFSQWFYFQLTGVAGQLCRVRLLNASETSYHEGWLNYYPLASYDRQHWFRIPASYDGTELQFQIRPEFDRLWLAYFEPYSLERHWDKLAAWSVLPSVKLLQAGLSCQQRPIDVLVIGEPAPTKPAIWLIARQHPGETMAQWCAEGLIERLLDPSDACSYQLRQQAVFYLVPNINPDGSYLGNLRTNAAGANLNREWLNPSAERSPEVLAIRQLMLATGVDLFLDLHGDESIEQVFVDGNDMLPSWTPLRQQRDAAFIADLLASTPDFQTEVGYAPDRFSDELLTLASKWVGHQFGCLSLTLEMPFKDHAANPHPLTHWSAERSRQLGANLLLPIWRHVLRQR
jgi:murein tripeptide amidase MpaA